jgi:hypothetical protein
MGAHNVSIILSIVITYVLLTVLLSLWTKKFTSTSSRFMTGGRDMGAFVIGVLRCRNSSARPQPWARPKPPLAKAYPPPGIS